MRVLLLSDISSEHTEKWAVGLASRGVEVFLFSIQQPVYNWYRSLDNVTYLNPGGNIVTGRNTISKIKYLKVLPALKKIIREINPDIVHAHYATSYGLLANLSGFRPYVVSAWGTDVMKFPDQNRLNAGILKSNLRRAAMVCATSNTIKEYIHKVVNCPVEVVAFGVDKDKFYPVQVNKKELIISCIKTLEKIYCIDILIEAYAIICEKHPNLKSRLLLVGPGSERQRLELLVKKLGIEEKVEFTGRVDYGHIQDYFNLTDIFVNISEYESLGVSVIEAMACEKPVVVTDVGGLREIVEDGISGIWVPVKDIQATAGAIEKLVLSEELRKKMGKAGRNTVLKKYNWENNVDHMITIYRRILHED